MSTDGFDDIRYLTREEVEDVMSDLTYALDSERPVRIAWDDGLKIKVGNETWSLPHGEVE